MTQQTADLQSERRGAFDPPLVRPHHRTISTSHGEQSSSEMGVINRRKHVRKHSNLSLFALASILPKPLEKIKRGPRDEQWSK